MADKQKVVLYRDPKSDKRHNPTVVAVLGEAVEELARDMGLDFDDLNLPQECPEGPGLWLLTGSLDLEQDSADVPDWEGFEYRRLDDEELENFASGTLA